MPYQVAYSKRPRVFKPITLITAGEDQLHICSPEIHLEGIVDGDLLGHTIEWEQISGDGETLINGNTLTPFFYPVGASDVVFRLYLDRGTPYEQFDDVLILRTPTSFARGSFNRDHQSVAFTLDPSPVDCSTITATVTVTIPPPTSTHGEEAGNNIDVLIEWEHPGDSVLDLHIAQYRIYENLTEVDRIPDTPIANAGDIQGAGGGPPSETLEYPGSLANYRIDTHYNIGGIEYVRPSCDKDFTNLTIPSVAGYNDAVDGMSYARDQHSLSRVLYSNLALQNESLITGMTFSREHRSLSTTRYDFISESLESAIAGMSFSMTNQSINITRVDSGGIGGVQIGG